MDQSGSVYRIKFILCHWRRGEPSVALLLLWEAEKSMGYTSGATALSNRLTTFSKQLVEVVEADDKLCV
jgi:hypothetical protein